MADSRQRELERRSTSGDRVVHAALVAERLRAGLITVEQVGVAAYLDDPAARECLGSAAPERVHDLGAWWAGLFRLAPEIGVRSAFLIASWFLRATPSAQASSRWAQALDLIACPCWWHREAVLLASQQPIGPAAEAEATAADLVRWAEQLALTSTVRDDRDAMARSVARRLAQVRRAGLGRGELHDLLRDNLAPWLLGGSDPQLSPEHVVALRAPRAAAFIQAPDDQDTSTWLGLFEPSLLLELGDMDDLWGARTAGAIRRDRWSVGSPRRFREGLVGPGGVGITMSPSTWIVESFLAWTEFQADAAARTAMRRAVAALGRYTRSSVILWTPTRTGTFDDAFSADRTLADIQALYQDRCGPAGDLDVDPTTGAWFLEFSASLERLTQEHAAREAAPARGSERVV